MRRLRSAGVYGTLAGAAVTFDAYNLTTPNADGQMRAIRNALRAGDFTPTEIGYVNAHATGTPIGDAVEALAIREVIGACPVTATKSMTGHLLGAAGAVEAIFTIISLREGIIPITRNLDEQDPDIQLDVVTGNPRKHKMTAAISNYFGFGGHNVALAFTS